MRASSSLCREPRTSALLLYGCKVFELSTDVGTACARALGGFKEPTLSARNGSTMKDSGAL